MSDTNPMTFDERLQAVWRALERVSEESAKQAQEINSLRLRVKRLEELVERMPTTPLDR
jgi:hypothetical protein